jgi:dihydropteroate synthase
MLETIAALKVPYIAMHLRGTPQTMTQHTTYDNLVKDITDHFHKKINLLHSLGIKDVVIDPGFGFAKTVEQNFELLNHLEYLQILGKPMLVGLSRKSMIWRTLNTTPDHALNGTTALHTLALLKGASILRVHDVKEAIETIKLLSVLNNSGKAL